MAGKGSLILILGFIFIFMVMGFLWGNLATRSVENHSSYYKSTIAHNIAVSGANLALNEIFKDETWESGIADKNFEHGKLNVNLTVSSDSSKLITSIGSFMGTNEVVKIKILKSTFAKYAWFISNSTGSTGRSFSSGDTVWGGFHSNEFINIDGDPVFFGKVSTEKGIKMSPGSNPEFLGGFTTGITVPFDTKYDFSSQETAAALGNNMGGNCMFNGENLWLTFNSNGTVTYRTGANNLVDDSSKYSTPVTVPISQLAPTGIIYVSKGDIYMSGTLNGQVTVVANQSSGKGGGNIYFTDDMVYTTSPMVRNDEGIYEANNNCTDMMGIIASNNVVISSSSESGGMQNNIIDKDIHIDAAIYCESGGFYLEDLGNSVNSPTGTIYLRGSMAAGKEESIAIIDKNTKTVKAGYTRSVVLDDRFLIYPPKYFPYSSGYEIISWFE